MSTIQKVCFRLVDPNMLIRTGFPIESSDTWDQNTPVKGGLMDLHQGTIDRRYVCQTCGQKEKNCPGHIAILRLCKPCYIVNMLDHIIKVLRCVCPDCSALLIAPEDVKECSLEWVADEVAGRAAHRFCIHGHPAEYLGDDHEAEGGSEALITHGCGAHRADYTKIDGLHIKGVFYELAVEEAEEVSQSEAEKEDRAGPSTKKRARKNKPKYVSREIVVTPEKAYMILRKISPEHARFMGFGDDQHPSWMIWTVLPIVPPAERPSIQMSAQRRGEDDLTCSLFAIIKANQELEKKISQGVHPSQLSPSYELLQYRVATYTTNDIQKQPKAKQRSGRESQGVVQKLKGKDGLVRGNQMGKRVNFSGRSVITGEPGLSVVEVGLPQEMAMILTKPIHVTAENMDECWERVLKGPYEYGGANSIVKRIKGTEYVVDLKLTRDRSEITLRKGMIIERHLQDGDWVIFNRQPTLHRMGMMAHRVRVWPNSTLGMNESVTPPYNADFDGDEMNIHAPQSERVIAELKWLCAVDNHLRSPKNSGATIGLVQDALLAGYLLSLDETFVHREIFFDSIMAMKHGWSRDIPDPVGLDADGRPLWTGKQLLSMAIPQELNLERGNVKIYSGELVEGTLDKKLLGVGSGSLVHLVVQQLGEDRARDFLDNLHDVCICWLKHRGFTFGFRDITIPEHLDQAFRSIVNEAKERIDAYLREVTNPETGELTIAASKVEATINQVLNQVLARAGKEVLPALPKSNLSHMALGAKSKGKESNITQINAYVGQQNIYGGRIPCGMIGRTTPHFRRGDLGLSNRGFVEHPYVVGLNPQEVFMHAAGGREGLVDTAIKSVTGDTPIFVLENGTPKRVLIGDWIDSLLVANSAQIQHYKERDMELLETDTRNMWIPTTDAFGRVSWGHIAAITRHDPGKDLYLVKTLGGRQVIVTESKSLLIWNEFTKQFVHTSTPEVKVGDMMPTTQNLPGGRITWAVDMRRYLPATEFVYGSEFWNAANAIINAGDAAGPVWWSEHLGVDFVLPYSDINRVRRCLSRSDTTTIKRGYVYPYCGKRIATFIPEQFPLNRNNGFFIGLYLADGDVDGGSVRISNNAEEILDKVRTWFDSYSVNHETTSHQNKVGGTSTSIRGSTTVMGLFLKQFCGNGAENKRVPYESYVAPLDFVEGLIDGYISGDGTVTHNSVSATSCSKVLLEGMALLFNRLGIFSKLSHTSMQSKNLGTASIKPIYTLSHTSMQSKNPGTASIKPIYTLSIRAQWCTHFSKTIRLSHLSKQQQLEKVQCPPAHRNFRSLRDTVLDPIVEITRVDPALYPKVYDLTVPSTLNFCLANGLHVVDTAKTGYALRQITNALSDISVDSLFLARNSRGNIIQFLYGGDNVDPTKLVFVRLDYGSISSDMFRERYRHEVGNQTATMIREEDWVLLDDEWARLCKDRNFIQKLCTLPEAFLSNMDDDIVKLPVDIDRLILDAQVRFRCGKHAESEVHARSQLMHPSVVIEKVNDLVLRIMEVWAFDSRLYSERRYATKMLRIVMRSRLASKRVIHEFGLSQRALNWLCGRIIDDYSFSIVQPGEAVGALSAQSNGEPQQQMTLNSVSYDTEIVILEKGCTSNVVSIGEWIDTLMDAAPSSIQLYDDGCEYLDLKTSFVVPTVSKEGDVFWAPLTAVTRHPPHGDMVKIVTRSGRSVVATKSKSLLIWDGKEFAQVRGDKVSIGDCVPTTLEMPAPNAVAKATVSLDKYLSKAEWIFGTQLDIAYSEYEKLGRAPAGWWEKSNGTIFTLPYNRCDTAMRTRSRTKSTTFKKGVVYPKYARQVKTIIPEELPLDEATGFMIGIYLAEGLATNTFVGISNNEDAILNKVKEWCDLYGITYHTTCSTNQRFIGSKTTDLKLHSVVLARLFKAWMNTGSADKIVPPEAYAAPDKFVKGLLDGYFSGDGTVNKRDKYLVMSSSSEKMLNGISTLCNRFGIFGKLSSHQPKHNNVGSQNIKRVHTLSIRNAWATRWAEQIGATHPTKSVLLATISHQSYGRLFEKRQSVVLDPIVSIEIVDEAKHPKVYDLTVPSTTNFCLANGLGVVDTFHFAGISSQNVTLGVPRIKEVIHCTREPKLVNTSIYLNTGLEGDKDGDGLKRFREAWIKRGEILELLVRDAIKGSDIIWDPIIGESVIEADRLVEMMHAATFPDYSHAINLSGHVIRMVFDPVKLALHNLSFGAVIATLRDGLGDGVTTACVYSDPDSLHPVFRVRARYPKRPLDMDVEGEGQIHFRQTEQSMLRRFYQQNVESMRLSGFEGVRNVFIREDDREGGLFLDTDCRNMQQAMALKGAISERCECNHPLEVYRTLGVEAARQSIIIEIRKVYRYYGINVDARHITLVADAMTAAGALMSIDRHGINNAEFNTLKKAAFEEINDVLTKAAVSGAVDPLCDNTSRIMLGQECRVGTGTFDLFLDRSRHEELAHTYLQSHRNRKRLQRRQRAIDARMRALDNVDRRGFFEEKNLSSFGTSPNIETRAPISTGQTVPMDPMAITAFSGTGFGFGGDGGYDPSNPFGFGEDEVEYGANEVEYGADEYDPSNPIYEPGIHIERRPRPYSPTSPRYSPTSPRYSPSSPSNAQEYDPSNFALYDNDADGPEYDPEMGGGGFFGGGGFDDDDLGTGW